MRIIYSKILDTFKQAERRVNKVLGMGKDDGRTAPQLAPYGIDSAPVDGLRALYVETPHKGKKAVIGYFDKNQLAEKGETRVYSTNTSGEVQTFIFLKADGTIEIGGDADNAVRYSELETAFNQLKSDFNDLVTKFNAHFHTSPESGSPTTPPLPPNTGSPSAADISGAKIEEIKTL